MEKGLEENGEPDRGGYPRSEEEVEYCGKQDGRREDEIHEIFNSTETQSSLEISTVLGKARVEMKWAL
ncbi:hypothetical protein BGAL_0522g00050 [Botrytis galanthina]|uniref:Uncharacterized protein n=1 Tax=Botrytis galanthina TaxID=278940 RepID=A0A4S8QWK0_9HELO|nr:hypothetical protein BGAL_0522g00050 [Botrytis galanthina]